jgi:TonB family protein
MKPSWSFMRSVVYGAMWAAFLLRLPSTSAQQAPEEVYVAGKDVRAPELLPMSFSTSGADACLSTAAGKIGLSMIVDATGHPRNIMFTKPLANDLDKLALVVVEADRFKPAMRGNTPVAVGQSADVSLKACVLPQSDGAVQGNFSLHLVSQPGQKFRRDESRKGGIRFAPEAGVTQKPGESLAKPSKVGDHISAPILLVAPVVEYTDQARKAGISGVCLISVIVDSHGLPGYAHVIRSLDSGLDKNALVAVSRYRFKPAMKDGEPVSVMITIEVNYRL